MDPLARPRIPPTLLAAVGAAFLVAALDVVDTILDVASGRAGAIVGTLVRDALILLAAGLTLRRLAWAGWVLVVLLALGLVRVLVADQWQEWAGAALSLAALVLLLLPASRAWWAKPKAAA